MTQNVQQGGQIGEREGDLRKEDVAEANEDMDEGIVENVVRDEALIDAPASKSVIGLKVPDRKKAIKRGIDGHDEEPSPKRIAFEDTNMEEDDGIDVDLLAAKREDQLILYHAVLGHDVTDPYSNKNLKFSAKVQRHDGLNQQRQIKCNADVLKTI